MHAAPRLTNIRLHPIKSLDPVWVDEARIGPAGGLELDRAWALYTVDNRWVNGKRTPAMLRIRAEFAGDLRGVTISAPNDTRGIASREFAFPQETEAAGEWFTQYFEQRVIVRHSRNGFPDDAIANGPTIISTATLRTICEWFPQLTLCEARRRFRTTLELDGSANSQQESNALPPFWEDRLFGPENTYAPRFRIGEVNFEGSNPCARCSVPPRNSYTGENIDGFQKRFIELRRNALPAWATPERFDHFYRLAVNTRVALSEAGKTLRVGDRLTMTDRQPQNLYAANSLK
jgi:uncharacterized protein